MKTSDISPVANRVFTRLSPSEPPGRVSCVILMLGLAAWKASITAFAPATSVSVFPVRKVIVCGAGLAPCVAAAETSRAAAREKQSARGARSHQRNAAPGCLM